MAVSGNRSVLAAAAAAALALGATARGDLIEPGLYELHDDPGPGAEPPYELRVDELFDVTQGRDVFSFDFDHADAGMFLEYDGSLLHIYGTAFGGLEEGSSYDPSLTGLALIDFVYATTAPGGDEFYALQGSIAWLSTGETVGFFGDGGLEDRGRLVRSGFPGQGSGWGWVDHTTPGDKIHWYFAASAVNRVPGPAVLTVFAVGLCLLGGRRRR